MTLIYRVGFNDAVEGAKQFLLLRDEIGEIENHECPNEDFVSCPRCDEIQERQHEMNLISEKWAYQWARATLRHWNTLPPQVWCTCGHIGGQHGVDYPHVCATGGNDGCENGCRKFTPKPTFPFDPYDKSDAEKAAAEQAGLGQEKR